jgi:ABC-type glycerol-3-phosphate transport system substrate-binding protein
MMFHRLFSLLIIAILLSACGEPALPPVRTPLAAVPEPLSVGPLLSITEADKTIVTFGVFDSDLPIYMPLVERFNVDNQDLQVELVTMDDLFLAALPKLHTDEGRIDFFRSIAQVADANTYPAYVPADAVRFYRNLAPFLAADPAFNPGDFAPGVLAANTNADGSIYSIPYQVRVQSWSYNRDLFRTRNIPEPQANWTWAEVRSAAERLASTDTQRPIYGMLIDGVGYSALASTLSLQSREVSSPTALEQPEVRAAFAEVVALAQRNAVYVQPAGELVLNPWSDLIVNGQVGMWPTGMIPPELMNTTSFSVGTAPAPVLPMQSVFAVGGFAMSVGTQHPELVWRWLSFLSHEVIALNANLDDGVVIPARVSVASKAQTWEQLGSEVSAAVQATLARPQPPHTSVLDLALALTEPLRAVLRGEATVDAALDAEQQRLAALALTPTPAATVGPEPIVVATALPALPNTAGQVTFTAAGLDGSALRTRGRAFLQADPAGLPVHVPSDQPGSFAAAIAGSDCFAWRGSPPADQAAQLRDLRPLIDADTLEPGAGYQRLTIGQIAPAALAPFTVDGRLVGLPYELRAPALLYDQSAALSAGLPADSSTWTLDQVAAAARQATVRGTQTRFGFATRDMPSSLLAWLEASGVQFVQGGGATARLDLTSPTTVAALRDYLALLADASPHIRFVYGQAGVSPDAVEQLISAGQVAFWVDDALNQSRQGVLSGAQATLAAAPFPRGVGGQRPAPTVSGLYISAASPNIDGCWRWLRYMESEGLGTRQIIAIRERFATPSDTALPGLEVLEAAVRMAPLVKGGLSAPVPGGGAVDMRWLYAALDATMQGAELEQALATAQQQSDQFSACFGNSGMVADCARQVEPGYDGWGAFAPQP